MAFLITLRADKYSYSAVREIRDNNFWDLSGIEVETTYRKRKES